MKRLLVLLCFVSILSCNCFRKANECKLYDSAAFEAKIDGKEVKLYTLQNISGMTMQVTNFGARVVSLWTPDKNGVMADIVLGYENLDRYVNNSGERFLGATIGRYGNRIANGKFSLGDVEYSLSTFNNGQCLHGGDKGFDMVVWNVDSVTVNSIHFSYLSKDMEEGFPGNLDVKMTYMLTDDNEFKVIHNATTDKATIVNLTHHSFFNLCGEGNGTINDHVLTINADKYIPTDDVAIPLGQIDDVQGTPFDFRGGKAIGADVGIQDIQLEYGNGYDHCWVLNRQSEGDLEVAATLWEPISGRFMEVITDEPGLQFYGGNFFDGKTIGKSGKSYRYRESLALETQHYPDSPNNELFPSTVLNPGEEYSHTCIYKFSIK